MRNEKMKKYRLTFLDLVFVRLFPSDIGWYFYTMSKMYFNC